MKQRRFWLWSTLVALLVAFTVAGLEALSAFVAPPWPARELRPIEVSNAAIASTLSGAQAKPQYNSWSLRDREHVVAKPAGTFRAVLVGDSFVEGAFADRSAGMRIEELWQSQGRRDLELVSLGVSATGPRQYYYRIRDIGLLLQPDAVVLVFYSGNDFVSDPLSPWQVPPLVTERPRPSWLGAVAPRLTWLLVNRLGLSEFGSGKVVGVEDVAAILKKPRAERVDAMVQFLKTHYFPQKDGRAMREILARGGDRFWDAFEPREHDQEYLQGWWIAGMVDWETATWPVPLTPSEIEQSLNRVDIAATMSWLLGAQDLARQRGIKFAIALAPVGLVDPRYAEFWSPWPRYLSFPRQREAMHRVLRSELEAKGVTVVDLENDLKGVPGTYRVSDGHWTELGTEIAARRLEAELVKMRGAR